MTGLFERVAGALFGSGRAAPDDEQERQLVGDMIELVVETVEPRIRLQARYADKLAPCVRTTIAYLRELGSRPMAPVTLARAAWRDDPCVNAYFAAADDVPALLGRTRELRDYFSDPGHAAQESAFALLAMKYEERKVLAPRQRGDQVEHDVAQVTVSFSGHRLVAPADSLERTRLEVGHRLIKRLAHVALSRIVQQDMKASELNERKAWLAARLRLVKLASGSAVGLLDDTPENRTQIAALERELKDTVHEYIEVKAGVATLDAFVRQIVSVFSNPAQHVGLRQTPQHLTRLGVRVEGEYSGPVNDFVLTELDMGAGRSVAIAIAHCPRAEMPPEEDLLAKAERFL
ncbi:hypothetical protein QTH91_21540 [Variovorax dokdonensis]|uniref:Uncharacterized protein n=1 Tax=Variovorax dokdonensis TaxID=344883 RepID=A0ABT7NGY6_9BURK|nr:hypothetical protein [Variovorax dokdonensis]MDM0047090.1 hypothetical protein [Variovorax dokdonensis]